MAFYDHPYNSFQINQDDDEIVDEITDSVKGSV